MSETKQLAINSDHGLSLNMGFMIAKTLDDAIKISEIIANSGVCPTAYKGKAGDVLVAMQMGAELGLKPMQALQNIAVINGRPSVWGDAMLAICRQSSQFEYIQETYDPREVSYTCIIKRRNEPEFKWTFSQKDAEQAALWTKVGPWKQYPKRMLQMRARGFALRDSFPDLLRGILISEEAEDYPSEKSIERPYNVATVVEGKVENIGPETINQEQLEILQLKLEQSKSDVPKFLKHYGLENLEAVTSSQWPNMIKVLDNKIRNALQADALKEMADNKSTPEVDQFIADLGEVSAHQPAASHKESV